VVKFVNPFLARIPGRGFGRAFLFLRRDRSVFRGPLFIVGMCVCALALSSVSAVAAAIGAGNLVIYRVGDGSAALSTTATAVFLDEYTPSGVFVQSIPLASTGASALTAVGTATSEGIISRAQNGQTLLLTGYRKDAGGANPSSDAPATTSRVIASVGISGVVNSAVAVTDAGGTMRSATSVDGSTSFYLSTSTGVRYVATPGSASTSTLIDGRNSRQVILGNNVLIASNGSTTTTGKVQSYGTLPTGPTTPTPLVNLATTEAVNGIALFDLSATVPGDDTLYIVSQLELLIRKYTFDGSAWNEAGSISAGGANNITGVINGTDVNLFATSSTSLFTFTDAGGTLAGSLGSAIAIAPANTAFRGIGLIPVPEPSAFLLSVLSLGVALGTMRRKR
jgi:hypothetical protein